MNLRKAATVQVAIEQLTPAYLHARLSDKRGIADGRPLVAIALRDRLRATTASRQITDLTRRPYASTRARRGCGVSPRLGWPGRGHAGRGLRSLLGHRLGWLAGQRFARLLEGYRDGPGAASLVRLCVRRHQGTNWLGEACDPAAAVAVTARSRPEIPSAMTM